MIRKVFRDHHDAWVAINLGTRFSTRMITLGLLVHYLTTTEVAAWYVFAALFGLVTLAEAGLGRVVTRQVAERFKASSDFKFKYSDLLYLSTILRFYVILLVVLCLIACVLGLWWFQVHMQSSGAPWLNLAWMIFVFANGVSLYSALNSAILQGLGEVRRSQRNETIASLVNLLFFIGVALVTASLLAPSIALAASTMASLLLHRTTLLIVVVGLKGFSFDFSFRYIKAITSRVAPELSKYFFMLLAFHLLTSAFVLMLNHYEKPAVVASYGITMQMITLVLTFSNIWLTSSFPKMAAQKGNKDHTQLKKLFISVASRGVGVLVLGMFSIATVGGSLLNLIGSQIELLPMEILQVLMLSIAIEYIIFTLMGQLLISQSMMKFTYYSVFGAFVISLAALMFLEFGYGIIAMYIARLILFMIIISVPIIKDTMHVLNTRLERSV